jgi:hypothetical protein
MEICTRAQARQRGWSDSALTRAVRSGRVVRVRHDQFVLGPMDVLGHATSAAAASRACAGSVVSHESAAVIHGLPLIGGPPARPRLTVSPRRTGDVVGALLHRATLRPSDIVAVDGVWLTSPSRTLVDLARSLRPEQAVAATDAALNRGLTSLDDLEDTLRQCAGWPGSRRARGAMAQVDGLAESPLESISRLMMTRFELPVPQLQTRVGDATGLPVARLDFYWEDEGVAGEADGQLKYESRSDLMQEKRRQEELETLGLVVVRWGWDDVTRRPELLTRRIEAALARGRARAFPRWWSVLATQSGHQWGRAS